MLCHSYRLLGLLFAVSASANQTPKQSVQSSTTGFTSPPFPTNSVSSYGTISSVSATNRSTELSKTMKHPHSKDSTSTTIYSTGTSAQTTKTKKHSNTPTGSFYPTNSTLTLPSATVSTVSSTTSSTPPPTCTPTSFKLQVTLAFDYPNPPPIAGEYITIVPGSAYDEGGDVMNIAADASQAAVFSLNADCTLQYGTEIAALPPSTAYHDFTFYTPAAIAAGGYYKTTCQTDGVGLSCTANTGSYYTNNVLFTCGGGGITIGPTGRPYQTYCYTLGLLLAPV